MKKYVLTFILIFVTFFTYNFSYAKIISKDDVSPEEWNRLMEEDKQLQEEREERAKEEQKEANEKFNMIVENKELEEKTNSQHSIIVALSIIIAIIIIYLIINYIRKNLKITIEKKNK